MFDIGFSELVLLFVIGLLILGPERLPRVAAQLGRWVGRARRTATQLRMQFEREMTMQDIMEQQKRKPPQPPEPDSRPAGPSDGDADTAQAPQQAPGEVSNDGPQPADAPAEPTESAEKS